MSVKFLKNMVLSLGLLTAPLANAGPVLWVGDSNGNLGTVDVTSGAVNVVGNMGVVMTDIAFDTNGNLYGISFDELFTIETNTASVSLIGSHGIEGGAKNSLVFGADGTLYAANSALYSLNTGTGASTVIGAGGFAYSSSGDLAFVNNMLYLSSAEFGSDKLIVLDTNTGEGALIGDIGYSAVYGLASDNNADLYGLSGTKVLSINTHLGTGTELLDYAGHGLGIAWGSAFYSEAGAEEVPAPATLALLALGLIGLRLNREKKSA